MLCLYAGCKYAECHILFNIMRNVIMPSVIMLSVVAPFILTFKLSPQGCSKVTKKIFNSKMFFSSTGFRKYNPISRT